MTPRKTSVLLACGLALLLTQHTGAAARTAKAERAARVARAMVQAHGSVHGSSSSEPVAIRRHDPSVLLQSEQQEVQAARQHETHTTTQQSQKRQTHHGRAAAAGHKIRSKSDPDAPSTTTGNENGEHENLDKEQLPKKEERGPDDASEGLPMWAIITISVCSGLLVGIMCALAGYYVRHGHVERGGHRATIAIGIRKSRMEAAAAEAVAQDLADDVSGVGSGPVAGADGTASSGTAALAASDPPASARLTQLAPPHQEA